MEWDGTVLEEEVKRLLKKGTFEQRSAGWEIVTHIKMGENNSRKQTSSKLREAETGRDQYMYLENRKENVAEL